MTNTTKNILIVVVVAVLLFVAYSLLVKKGAKSETTKVGALTERTGPGAFSAAQEAATTLDDIRRIRVDTGLFSGGVFSDLKDFRINILPEPVGRDNPFTPIN